MAVKPYELHPQVFKKIEAQYSQFSPTELIKVNFLVQIIMESNVDTDIEISGTSMFIKLFQQIPQDKMKKVNDLGYKVENGRIKIK